MAKPIEIGLVVDGDDAIKFWENEKKEVTAAQKQVFKDAMEIYKTHQF